MKIGILSTKNLQNGGGCSVRLEGLSKNLSSDHDVTIFSKGEIPNILKNNVNHKKINLDSNFYSYSFRIYGFGLRKIHSIAFNILSDVHVLKKSDIDVLHCAGHLPSYLIKLIENKLDFPHIFDMHGLQYSQGKIASKYSLQKKIEYPLKVKSEEKLINETDFISTPSKKMSIFVKNHFSKDNGIFTIPTGVDINLFNKYNFDNKHMHKKKLGINGKKVIMYVGGTGPLHDFLNLIKSFNIISENRKDVCFIIISKGISKVYKKKYKYYKRKIDNLIKLPPFPHDKLPYYLSLADILVINYPNNIFSNLVPHIKTYEYMASGKPIVATKTKGNKHVLKHMKNSYLVEPEDPEETANGIKYLLDNPDDAKKLGKNAKKDVKNYTWEKSARKAVNVYQKILNQT